MLKLPAMRLHHCKPGGLTLVELLIALAVLGTLLLLALPGVGSWLRDIQVRNAAESMANGLQQARAEAIRRNRPVFFSLVTHAAGNPGALDNTCAVSADAASWVVSLSSPAGACAANPGSSAPQIIAKQARGNGSPDVSLSGKAGDCSTAASTGQLVFNGFGRLTGTGTLRCLQLAHARADTRALRVLISGNGTVRTCDPAVTAADDPRRCTLG